MRLSGNRKARRQVFLLAMKELSFSKVQRPISLRHRSLVSDDCVFGARAKPGPACACWTDARKRIVVNYHTSCAERHNHRSQVTPDREYHAGARLWAGVVPLAEFVFRHHRRQQPMVAFRPRDRTCSEGLLNNRLSKSAKSNQGNFA